MAAAVSSRSTTETGTSSDQHSSGTGAGAATSVAGTVPPVSAPATLTNQSDSTSRLPTDITSPHELTDWVDAVLDRLESRFQSANQQYEVRMQEMSDRIDNLETSIQNLINGAVGSSSSKQGSSSSPRE